VRGLIKQVDMSEQRMRQIEAEQDAAHLQCLMSVLSQGLPVPAELADLVRLALRNSDTVLALFCSRSSCERVATPGASAAQYVPGTIAIL
jgi:hypothetical protein